MEKPIKLGLVDNHKLVRDGFAMLLSLNSDRNIKIVLEADNGADMLAQLGRMKAQDIPDVLLLDIIMPEMDGEEAAKRLRKKYPSIKVIAVSVLQEKHYAQRMFRFGVKGYLCKAVGKTKLKFAIEEVLAGRKYIDPELSRNAPNGNIESIRRNSKDRKVLTLLAGGHTTSEIADKMFLGIRTIEGYREKLLQKLGAKNAVELISIAHKQGLID